MAKDELVQYDLEGYRKLIFMALRRRLRFNKPITRMQSLTSGQLDKLENNLRMFEEGKIDKLIILK